MDLERYEIKIKICIVSFFLLSFLLIGCKENKNTLVKSIDMDGNYVLKIVLDNTNSNKKIGKIKNLELNSVVRLGIDNIEETETEIILTKAIVNSRDCFYDNEEYKFNVAWYGGQLNIYTLYKDGQFTILKESYGSRR